jgi:hypothetical protein
MGLVLGAMGVLAIADGELAESKAIQTPNAVSQPVSPASAAKPVAMHRPKPLTSQTLNQTQPPQPAAAPTKSEVRYIKIND